MTLDEELAREKELIAKEMGDFLAAVLYSMFAIWILWIAFSL